MALSKADQLRCKEMVDEIIQTGRDLERERLLNWLRWQSCHRGLTLQDAIIKLDADADSVLEEFEEMQEDLRRVAE